MARPLPNDLETQIASTAKRSEIRSVALFAFIAGGIVGFAVAASIFGGTGVGQISFLVVAGMVAIIWGVTALRRKR